MEHQQSKKKLISCFIFSSLTSCTYLASLASLACDLEPCFYELYFFLIWKAKIKIRINKMTCCYYFYMNKNLLCICVIKGQPLLLVAKRTREKWSNRKVTSARILSEARGKNRLSKGFINFRIKIRIKIKI